MSPAHLPRRCVARGHWSTCWPDCLFKLWIRRCTSDSALAIQSNRDRDLLTGHQHPSSKEFSRFQKAFISQSAHKSTLGAVFSCEYAASGCSAHQRMFWRSLKHDFCPSFLFRVMSSELGLEIAQRQSANIYYAVEESIYWLENAGRSISTRPVGYSIRIAWEMLYRAKEELNQSPYSSQIAASSLGQTTRLETTYSLDSIDSLAASIDTIMKEILSIDIKTNLTLAQQSARRCSAELNACLLKIGGAYAPEQSARKQAIGLGNF